MTGRVFGVIMLLSLVTAVCTGNTERMSDSLITSVEQSVSLCINLLGMMCFWSGIMNVFREMGALKVLSRVMRKPMGLVFGKNKLTREDEENLSASFAADFLGLGNAALPFGIKAMKSLNKGRKDSLSDMAAMHAVLNTVPIQLIPTTLIALRSKNGSVNPVDVVPAIWLCSVVITVFAVIVCKIMAKLWKEGDKGD